MLGSITTGLQLLTCSTCANMEHADGKVEQSEQWDVLLNVQLLLHCPMGVF